MARTVRNKKIEKQIKVLYFMLNYGHTHAHTRPRTQTDTHTYENFKFVITQNINWSLNASYNKHTLMWTI